MIPMMPMPSGPIIRMEQYNDGSECGALGNCTVDDGRLIARYNVEVIFCIYVSMDTTTVPMCEQHVADLLLKQYDQRNRETITTRKALRVTYVNRRLTRLRGNVGVVMRAGWSAPQPNHSTPLGGMGMPMKSIAELYQYVGRKGTLSISNGWTIPIECVNVRQVGYGHTDYQVRPIDAEGKPIWVRVGLTWDEEPSQ